MDFFYKAAGAILAPFRYAQREIESVKDDLKTDARKAFFTALKITALIFFALFFMLFSSIAAAMAINESMNSAWSGYAIVAGLYLVLAFCMYVWQQTTDKKKHRQVYPHAEKTATL